MNLLIRNAKKEDWDEIKYIYEAGISTGIATFETQAPSTYEQWIFKAHPKCTLIAHGENKILGWCKITPISDRLAYAGVGEVSIYVHPKAQGEGVGYILLKNLITISEVQGFWTLQASIFPENNSSICLHKKNGFREVGFREKIGKLNGIWRDNVLLERRNSLGLGIQL
ncbi:phosphinothricin acetyltransferase [Psychrobacillus sp. OK028]|uniref:GNAT family N-acetyltransferase n=1 Tax=Psychrobacillus sp. OK028 TaxID=1884359 RepID=UPI00087EC8EC|nr:GNAT family N-acetyltransferase [Psychrobacillus sp. OK028]SDO25526.1 phosphinothricin acetyltransferase [Psychrobacillus sp. OK028]